MSFHLRLCAVAAATVFASPVLAAPGSIGPGTRDASAEHGAFAGGIVLAAFDSTVRDIQQQLNARGLNAGPADGLMGRRTRDAIERYQRRNGLRVTGQPSESLLEHLRSNTGRTTQSADPDREVATRQIVRLQRQLRRLGYDARVTGEVDASTRAAVRSYQRDNRLLVTGEVSRSLVDHVREAAQAVRADRRAGPDSRDGGDGRTTDAPTIRQIQKGLQERGYRVGNLSGELDATTRESIRAYQRDRGIEVTGTASAALAAQLAEGMRSPVSTPENIRKVQDALNRRGYSAGPADGVSGPSTRRAIRAYKARSNLPVSDDVTRDLLASLGIEVAGESAPVAAAPSRGPGIYMREDFESGDFRTNPRWRVLSKEFRVEAGALTSSVTVAQQSERNVGEEMIKGIFGEVLGIQGQQQNDAAVIAYSVAFPNAFELRAKVRQTSDRPGRIQIGAYTGANAEKGYRLRFDSQETQSLAILRATASDASAIAGSAGAPDLHDGKWHELTFSRDEGGRMSVAVDGTVVLAVTDNSVDENFSGVAFFNGGGDWELDEIMVRSAGT